MAVANRRGASSGPAISAPAAASAARPSLAAATCSNASPTMCRCGAHAGEHRHRRGAERPRPVHGAIDAVGCHPAVDVVQHVVGVPTPRPAERDECQQHVTPPMVRLQPVERGTEVQQVTTEQVKDIPRRLASVDPFQFSDPPVGVRITQHRELTSIGRPVERIVADGLQQPVVGVGVPVTVGVLVELHQALVNEPADEIHDGPFVEISGGSAERLGQPEAEAARAHAQPAQHAALVVIEQVVAPFHRAPATSAGAAAPSRAPPVSSRNRWPRSPAIRSGGSCRQRAAASSIASGIPSSCRQMSITALICTALEPQVRPCPAGTVDEQLDRVELVERCDLDDRPGAGSDNDGTRHVTSPARPSGSRLVASTTMFERPLRNDVDRRGCVGDKMLAVVEHHHCRVPRTADPGRSRWPAVSRPRSPRSRRATSIRSPRIT